MFKYPRIRDRHRLREPQGLCVICGGNKADMQVDIQVSWFRGEDVVKKVHRRCLNRVGHHAFLKMLREQSCHT